MGLAREANQLEYIWRDIDNILIDHEDFKLKLFDLLNRLQGASIGVSISYSHSSSGLTSVFQRLLSITFIQSICLCIKQSHCANDASGDYSDCADLRKEQREE